MTRIEDMAEILARREPLAPELAAHLYGYVLRHPLVSEHMAHPNLYGLYNHQLEASKEHAADALAKKDYASYIFTHDKAFRMDVLAELASSLTVQERSSLFADVWTDIEFTWENGESIEKVLGLGIDPDAAMDDGEKAVWNSLPDEFTVWRGNRNRDIDGPAWTLDREQAEWFARREPHPLWLVLHGKGTAILPDNGMGWLVEGIVAKADALIYVANRNESEIVIPDPTKVRVTSRTLVEHSNENCTQCTEDAECAPYLTTEGDN